MSTEIEITDNSEELLEALEKASDRALIAVGMEAETNAKHLCTAVDTGRLRNSITYATSNSHSNPVSPATAEDSEVKEDVPEKTVVIGSNVFYAPFIELGHHSYPGLHFLKNAVANYQDKYLEIIKADMESE